MDDGYPLMNDHLTQVGIGITVTIDYDGTVRDLIKAKESKKSPFISFPPITSMSLT
jgi:hypothetical protein